ncbi:Uncharacterized protein GBIM_15073, partial [Gryllus bimaculatus]
SERSEERRRVLRFLNESLDEELQQRVKFFLAALSLYQHPLYARMTNHLNETPAVLPTCEELFLGCDWRGRDVNCCEEFQLQRYEGGFCYSFNSLTSERRKHWQAILPLCSSSPATQPRSKLNFCPSFYINGKYIY